MDDESSRSLIEFMTKQGLIPSLEEEAKRQNIIHKLRQMVVTWAKKVAWQRQLPKEQIRDASATILAYGSYGLGVHDPESDIDALCVGPHFATLAEDFFIVLSNIIKSRSEVSDVHCVKDAKVPLIRFKFDGISVDLAYAQLNLLAVSEDVNVFNVSFLRNIDQTSWKSLSGVRANQRLLHLVPDVENFRALLRCVKLWAKQRGVYGNLNGFLGGIHLAILAAFICQQQPNASVAALLFGFFRTFATWQWPNPVILQDGLSSAGELGIETSNFMPVRLPTSPYEYCHSNITQSTFRKIRTELLRGYTLAKNFLRKGFDWAGTFDRFMYTKNYTRFIKIYVAAHDQDELGLWVGRVKSCFPHLLLKLESLQGFCDPNPTKYMDIDTAEPNVVFYWGLKPGCTNNIDIDSVEEDFLRNIYHGYFGIRRKLEFSIVQSSELSEIPQLCNIKNMRTKAYWKIPEDYQRKVPTFSLHLPDYFVGYTLVENAPENQEWMVHHMGFVGVETNKSMNYQNDPPVHHAGYAVFGTNKSMNYQNDPPVHHTGYAVFGTNKSMNSQNDLPVHHTRYAVVGTNKSMNYQNDTGYAVVGTNKSVNYQNPPVHYTGFSVVADDADPDTESGNSWG